VDQRGTGHSADLSCALYSPADPGANLRNYYPPDAVDRCRAELGKRADLSQYSNLNFASDLEQVRRALGYGPLNLFALSYGTRAAQVYMRLYPRSVRTVYMGSIVPTDVATPLPFARAAQVALDTIFAACAAAPSCHGAYPQLSTEFRQVMSRLDSGRVRVAVPGGRDSVTLARGRVAERIRAMLYKPEGAANVPWLIHQMAGGDYAELTKDMLASAAASDSGASWGLFFSITCGEDVQFLRESDIAPQVKSTFSGDYRVRQQQRACAKWPKPKLSSGYRDPLHSSIPTLFVGGDADPATPLWTMEHAVRGFAQRVEVVLHGQAHTGWSDCVAALYDKLVLSGSVSGLSGACPPTPRPPFKVARQK